VVRGQVLAYLLDVKTSTQLSGGKQGFQLAFVFAENPYFSDRLLTKTYLMDPEDEDECLERAAGCQINWKEGMNVTVKLVQKKQKKKGKTRTARPAALRPPPPTPPQSPRRAAAPPRRRAA
jgi:nucleosome assembly protein 1-like 1